jgi:HNH endonuclease
VNLYIYPTDLKWFDFLRSRSPIDEVNFWQPGGRHAFTRLQVGELFLFRLKSPVNMIGGGGFFVHSSIYPLRSAWEAFGEKNGTSDPAELTRMIAGYKGISPDRLAGDAPIGCIILADPFFWPEDQWIEVPPDYQANLVQGKKYDIASGTGRALFDAVVMRLQAPSIGAKTVERVIPELGWRQSLVRQRIGQGGFRVLVTDLYGRRCAVTGERTLPVLEAAHIRPITRGGTHDPGNGLLLRSDIHTLFDLGYVTIRPNGHFHVSSRLRDEWSNGKVYYALENTDVRPPNDSQYTPSKELLEWHSDTIFRG